MTKAYPVVATQYGELTEAEVKALAHGTPAMLVRDPLNKFDPNAIAVYIDGKRVGYIPKKNNVILATFIDQTGAEMAMDGSLRRTIRAKFTRSPNSGFPMVTVDG